MLQAEQLLEYGFKEDNADPLNERFKKAFYYWFKVNGVKKFDVCVKYWRFESGIDGVFGFEGWSAECDFNELSPKDTFRVILHSCNDKSPAEIVEWFDRIFTRMECSYYDSSDQ